MGGSGGTEQVSRWVTGQGRPVFSLEGQEVGGPEDDAAAVNIFGKWIVAGDSDGDGVIIGTWLSGLGAARLRGTVRRRRPSATARAPGPTPSTSAMRSVLSMPEEEERVRGGERRERQARRRREEEVRGWDGSGASGQVLLKRSWVALSELPCRGHTG